MAVILLLNNSNNLGLLTWVTSGLLLWLGPSHICWNWLLGLQADWTIKNFFVTQLLQMGYVNLVHVWRWWQRLKKCFLFFEKQIEKMFKTKCRNTHVIMRICLRKSIRKSFTESQKVASELTNKPSKTFSLSWVWLRIWKYCENYFSVFVKITWKTSS